MNRIIKTYLVLSLASFNSLVMIASRGNLEQQDFLEESSRRKGTKVSFIPDEEIFKKYNLKKYVKVELQQYHLA